MQQGYGIMYVLRKENINSYIKHMKTKYIDGWGTVLTSNTKTENFKEALAILSVIAGGAYVFVAVGYTTMKVFAAVQYVIGG